MKNLRDMLNALIAAEPETRPDTMLTDILTAIDAEELAYSEAATSAQTELAAALEANTALTKRVQELTAHNYSLMTSVGTPVSESDDIVEGDADDDDDPIDSLFGED